ncbi:hypothetical protein QL285_073188 [Trifolium repens]|nr:hypothetical protein QL285_073188 [Trifolium repens]
MEQAKCTALAADEGVEGVVPVPVTDKWAEKQAEKEERSLFEVILGVSLNKEHASRIAGIVHQGINQ